MEATDLSFAKPANANPLVEAKIAVHAGVDVDLLA